MSWRNQNMLTSRMPRIGVLAVVGLGVAAFMYTEPWESGLLFFFLVAAVVLPMLGAGLWVSLRNVAVASVAVDVDGRRLSLQRGKETIPLAPEDIRAITLSRGLIWIETRSKIPGFLVRPAFLLALYDGQLVAFVRAAESAGFRVSLAFGRPVGDDFDGSYAG